jgi:hypothetical protein
MSDDRVYFRRLYNLCPLFLLDPFVQIFYLLYFPSFAILIGIFSNLLVCTTIFAVFIAEPTITARIFFEVPIFILIDLMNSYHHYWMYFPELSIPTSRNYYFGSY